MLGAIVSKEFLNNILNLRFIVGLLLCVILTLSCVVILTHDYQQEMRDYNLRVSLQDDFLNKYAHTNRMGGRIVAQKPPEQFRPLIIGIPSDANLGSFDDNPLPILFPPLDLLFIVTVIMSLLAILFSYDAVAGERERGTLRLTVANHVPRASILLGKWLGGTASLLFPFVLSLVAAVLYITIHPGIQWDSSAWATFFLLGLASVTFISLFYLMGLLVSTFTRYSSASILTSLFLWVLFVLVIPNSAPYISAQLYHVPSVNKIEREVNRLRGIDRDDLGRKLVGELNAKYQRQYGPLFEEYRRMNRQEIRDRTAVDVQFRKMHTEYTRENNEAWREANRIQGEKADKISSELHTRAAVQTTIAKNLACLSPYPNFVYLATDLSGTGLRSLSYFERSVQEYGSILTPYIMGRVQEAQQRDPTFDSNSFLDISDRPRFVFKEEPLKDRLTAVLPYWGILLLFNVLFFAGAFVRFMKYDVR